MEKLSGSRSLNMPSDLQHGWRLIINLWHISQRNENRPCKVKQGSSSCERQCGKRPETLLIERDSAFAGLPVTPTLILSSLLLSAIPHRWESVKTENRHFPQARYTFVSTAFFYFKKAQYYTVTACFPPTLQNHLDKYCSVFSSSTQVTIRKKDQEDFCFDQTLIYRQF